VKYSWSTQISRVRLWVAGEGDARYLYPKLGVLNTRPCEWPGIHTEDGELTVYAAWWIFEVSILLKHRPAQCVRGEAGHRAWWDKTRER
jgi:hypothetical protein